MKTIKIEIPETKEELKEAEKRIFELDKNALKVIQNIRKIIDKEFSLGYKEPLFFLMCCETCKFEGGAFWHCHNPESFKCHINVNQKDVCSNYMPNWGLMTYLWYRAWLEKSEERRKTFEEKEKEITKRFNKNADKLGEILD